MKTAMQAIRMVVLISLLVGISTLWTGEGRAQGPGGYKVYLPLVAKVATDSCSPSGLQKATLSIDGVILDLCTPFLPAQFIEPDSDNTIQVATSVNYSNFQEFSITAVPFGAKPSTEDLPVAQSGVENIYRVALYDYRKQQGGNPQDGVIGNFFGKQVTSSISIVKLNIDGTEKKNVVIIEWVVETPSRIWIIRASRRYGNEPVSRNKIDLLASSFNGITLSSPDENRPSISMVAQNNPPISVPPISAFQSDLPFPSWWSGDCDTNNFYAFSGKSAYPLGGSYRGVKACGPRPYYEGPSPGRVVRFFSGAWGEYEWQCVELSMRYLYLAYNIAPYSGNGSNVVWNYSGNRLAKISNGTAGKAPKPGDVLSYGSTTTEGHTSVVATSNVDSNGNGNITIIEQNAASNGTRTHSVTNWFVNDSTTISGWLQDPIIPPTTVATLSGTQGSGTWYRSAVQVTLTTTDNGGGAKNTQYKIDNGAWQTGTSFTVSGDGPHTIYYKSQDNAGNWEGEKSTAFGIDTVAPTGSLVVNNNAAETYSTLVSVVSTVSEATSGMSEMRLGYLNPGGRDQFGMLIPSSIVWGNYQPYSSPITWQLPVSYTTTCIQLKDQAGNQSPGDTRFAICDSITLNLYPARPTSTNYSMLKSTFGTVGQQSNQSASYTLHGTLGQPSMVSLVSSANYQLRQGYWGGTTIATTNECGLPISPNFTESYGTVNLNNQAAAVGTLIEAINPRGQVIGCFTVSSSGQYGTMRIYGEDTSVTPNVPGMRAGETVTFRVANQTATASPTLVWQNDRATQVINLTAPALNNQQTIALQPGWNLISLNVEPTTPTVAQVLSGLNYSRVLGESGSYIPTLSPSFNSLKELHAKQAYYLYYSGTSSTNLVIQGTAVAANSPITLKAGWNWLGYLPSTTLPINTALASITGQYQRVLGSTGTYIPSLPTFSTLTQLAPGQGYLVYMNNAATLTYPNNGGGRGVADSVLTACPAIAMTPYVSLVYGQLQVNGQPAPLGSRVQAINPTGQVVGCVEVTTTGQFGLMSLYGANETEMTPLTFQVNGVPAATSFRWQNDRDVHALELSITIKQQYLPLIVK